MQLVQAGKVTLDAPVHRYLPWFRLADARASGRITVRQLLIQTSGISTAAGVDPLRGRATTLEAQVRALATVQGATPGRSFTHSNANYEVLGLVVQAVVGEPYGAYVARHIFTPLGMRRSYVDLAAARAAGLAQGHILWFGQVQARDAYYRSDFLPAGFLVSDAADMARYLVAQVNDGRYGTASVLAPAGIAALHRPEVSEGTPGRDARYGMGWVTSTLGGQSMLWLAAFAGLQLLTGLLWLARACAIRSRTGSKHDTSPHFDEAMGVPRAMREADRRLAHLVKRRALVRGPRTCPAENVLRRRVRDTAPS